MGCAAALLVGVVIQLFSENRSPDGALVDPYDHVPLPRVDDGDRPPTAQEYTPKPFADPIPLNASKELETIELDRLDRVPQLADGVTIVDLGRRQRSSGAVDISAGLQWLFSHQRPDGGWSFDHNGGACTVRCGDPGEAAEARNAATALAVLSFLGVGFDHIHGEHKWTVAAGLSYLVDHMESVQGGGSLHEPIGAMTSHALGCLAICEAYSKTGDERLHDYAQQSINFIAYAQDPQGGGWRYQPRQPGNMVTTGWQIMALESAHFSSSIVVPQATITGSAKFLDGASIRDNVFYGDMGPGKESTATAIGLHSRIVLGWDSSHQAIHKGVRYLTDRGPSNEDMLYNFFATQVMRRRGGYDWSEWNEKLRAYLAATQVTQGHAKGSWFFGGARGKLGGRLYHTAMAMMILCPVGRAPAKRVRVEPTGEFPL